MSERFSPDIITIMGPTASGKTAIAAHLAHLIGGVIISGDSRQVYKGMDIGTGKDLDEYTIEGSPVPFYLIDICDPGDQYNIYRYKKDFYNVYDSIPDTTPKILCGGSGLYIESVIDGYHIPDVAGDQNLRKQLEEKPIEELIKQLESYGPLHNTTDIQSKKRVIRAIEIAAYKAQHPSDQDPTHRDQLRGPIFVIDISRETRRERISKRLKDRLHEGLIEEVQSLLRSGLSPESLIYYGLEYKYVTEYVIGRRTFDEMYERLEIAIHQFAKRQMTWLRGMERRGHTLTHIQPENTPMDTALKVLTFLQ